MTCEEFSNQFDVLLNSRGFVGEATRNSSLPPSISLDEYEKSIYLTKAQDELVVALYTGRTSSGDPFESTEEERRYLSNLVRESNLKPETNSSGLVLGIGSNSKFFTLKEDVWYITYESVKVRDASCRSLETLQVVPVTQDDYNRTRRNPFRGPNDRRALRLDLSDGVVEIVSTHDVESYYVRYLKKPDPIILTDLPDGLKIDNECKAMTCKLNSSLHQRILERAVAEAVQTRGNIKQ